MVQPPVAQRPALRTPRRKKDDTQATGRNNDAEGAREEEEEGIERRKRGTSVSSLPQAAGTRAQ